LHIAAEEADLRAGLDKAGKDNFLLEAQLKDDTTLKTWQTHFYASRDPRNYPIVPKDKRKQLSADLTTFFAGDELSCYDGRFMGRKVYRVKVPIEVEQLDKARLSIFCQTSDFALALFFFTGGFEEHFRAEEEQGQSHRRSWLCGTARRQRFHIQPV